MKKGMTILLSVIFFANLCAAQNANRAELTVKVDQIISAYYPRMTAYVSVRDKKGDVFTGLAPGLFFSRIDTQEFKAKTQIIPFSLVDSPVDYTIVMSNNGIMEGEPLDFQKNAIIQFADLLKKTDTLSVYTIGEEAVPVVENVKKDDFDPALINGVEVSAVQPRVYDSLMYILRKTASSKTERKIIIVMSDGRDQNSRFTKEQLDAALTETGVPVYTIGMRILGTQTLASLNQIADLTGGTYFYASSVRQVPDNLKKIQEYVTKCYVIRYKVKGLKADNVAHLLEVTVDERDSFGKGQKTFIAVKLPVPRWVQWLVVVCAVVLVAVLIVLAVLGRIKKRKSMGITRRRCAECGTLMKDSWDSCPFCRYLPDMKKKKAKGKKK